LPLWLYSGSLLNIGVIIGGTIAALLSREFAIRVPARAELAKGSAGGLLMGVGAVLAFGCNIGGFFSATSALSLSGLGMMLGLGAGAFIGIRYLIWEVAHRPQWLRRRAHLSAAGRGGRGHTGRSGRRRPGRGKLFPTRVRWAAACSCSAPRSVHLPRPRFCLVRAQEPFMTGDAEHTGRRRWHSSWRRSASRS
jgi:hypothetical protein